MSVVIAFSEIQSKLQGSHPDAWIDLDFGQLEAEPEHFPLPEHCVVIDFNSIEWVNIGQNIQHGNALIRFRNAFLCFEDSYMASETKVDAIAKMKEMELLHNSLQGLEGSVFTALERSRSFIERRDDGRRVFVMEYRSIITDQTGSTFGLGGESPGDPIPAYDPALA
jgi:hypothetical protein